MQQNKLIKSVLISLFVLNVALVLLFPMKAPKITDFTFPNSPVDPQISVSFSELMDKATVNSAFQIYPKVQGKISWAGKKFVFTPDQNLDFGKKYEIKFDSSARSMRGQGMSDVWLKNFQTMPSSFLFVNKDDRLERYFLADSGDKKLTPVGMKIKQYNYSADLGKIVFVTREDKIYLSDLNGAEPKEVKNPNFVGAKIGKAKWLPFENALLITKVGEDKTALWSYNVDTGYTQLIKESETLSYDFFPSPDGKQVLYIDDSGALALHDIKTGKDDFVVRDFFEHFGFSEYGGYVLYTIMTAQGVFDFSNNLVLHKNNGDKEVLFKGKNVRIEGPTISQNEDFLAFEYTKDDSNNYAARVSRLGILDLATQKLLLATPESYQIKAPQISPDQSIIIFNKFPDEDHTPGWDLDKKVMNTTELFSYKLKGNGDFTGTISDLKTEGAEVQWVY